MQPGEERLVDERAVSELTGIKVRTLRKWRLQGRGPEVRRIEGRLVRYSLRDVQDWMRGQPRLKSLSSQQEKLGEGSSLL
jgi:predicted DNA-binding transcriptional regulator AlpA